MPVDRVRNYLKQWNLQDKIQAFETMCRILKKEILAETNKGPSGNAHFFVKELKNPH